MQMNYVNVLRDKDDAILRYDHSLTRGACCKKQVTHRLLYKKNKLGNRGNLYFSQTDHREISCTDKDSYLYFRHLL